MYKLLVFFFLFLFSVQLKAQDKELVIYTNKYLPMQGTINKMFFDKTGIMVSTISSSEEELLNKLGKQKLRDKADIVMGATLYEMEIIKESSYLQPIEDKSINEIIPECYKDKTGMLIPISLNPRLLVYNKYTLPAETFNSYMNVFPKEYNIKTSQRTFLNKYNKSLVAHLLKNYKEKEVRAWLENISTNMLEKQKGNDRYSLRKVAKAESAYTFANGSDIGLMLNSKNKDEKKLAKSLSLQFSYFKNNSLKGEEKEDTRRLTLQEDFKNNSLKEEEKEVEPIIVNVFTVGVLKNAKNKDYAIEYIKFLLSEKVQDYIVRSSYEIAINKNVRLNKIYSSLDEKMIPTSINYEDVIFYNIKADNLIREIPNLLP